MIPLHRAVLVALGPSLAIWAAIAFVAWLAFH